ncbi:MAG: glycoside hydrolase family 52 protein [Bacillota bacterium]
MSIDSLPPFSGNISFNAQHSPMGAFMTFACGHFSSRGGVAAQIGKPANHDLFIGIKDGSRFDAAPLKCLPFFSSARAGGAGAADFQGEQAGPAEQNVTPKVTAYRRDEIQRRYGWATDTWSTDAFTFTVFTPFGAIPDPATASPSAMRRALVPAVIAELVVDNTHGQRTRTAFFAMNFNEPGWRPIESIGAGRRGFGLHRDYGILGTVVSQGDEDSGVIAPSLFCRWSPEQGISDAVPHRLGSCPGLLMEVPPGQRRILRLAIGCYIDGLVTTGLEGRYLYTRYFSGLEDVLTAALDGGDPRPASEKLDQELLRSGLSADQQFMIAHATHGYYGSTQLLDIGGEPFWVVNEGEYCMMNTLDLSVDHMFWELEQNPWVVRNLLDNFVRHYSFVDALKTSGSGGTLPGGISFTHDMGAHNHFTPHAQSSYELPDLPAVCFSHMTGEQLCNWTLMAATYVISTGDIEWARQNSQILSACLESLRRRGGETAIPSFDSARCGTGAEITTYDSLDHSLAQTRNSLYMAVKFWACYIGLGIVFGKLGESWRANQQDTSRLAKRAEQSILQNVGPDGVLPAVFEKDNSGYRSRILPASEGLLYALMWGSNPLETAPALCSALKRHTIALLKDPEKRNLFPDGGIRLSSTSSNSWMSKIAIFMHVARRVFQLDRDPAIASLFEQADRAHVKWQTDGSSYWACSDQFIDGVAKASRWYPRIITSALWMVHAGREA